jgi:ribosome maturation factor RimP
MTRENEDQLQSVRSRVTSLAEEVASTLGVEVILIEIRGSGGRSVVRIFIDQAGGITLQDCERFSKRLAVLLDVEDCVPFSYALEVSSPGIDRPLVKASDYERFSGKNATVRTKLPIEGQRRFKGRIGELTESRVTLELEAGRKVEIPLAEIEKANLVGEI